MKSLNRTKIIQLIVLFISFILIVYFFGGDEVNGQEVEPKSYQQISDHRIARDFKHDIRIDADDPKQIIVTAREHHLLRQVTYHEARGECLEGMKEVVKVVLNRVDHPSFPNSIEDVIFQEKQFCSASLIDKHELDPGYIANIDIAISKALVEDENDRSLYFFNPEHAGSASLDWFKKLEYVKTIGNHEFYR